jgi:hypothetical protein
MSEGAFLKGSNNPFLKVKLHLPSLHLACFTLAFLFC